MEFAALLVISLAALVVATFACLRSPESPYRGWRDAILLSIIGLLIVRAGFVLATVFGGEVYHTPAIISEVLLLVVSLGLLGLTLQSPKARTDAASNAIANAAALSREAQLRAALDSAPDSIFIKDAEGRYILINAASLRELGRPGVNPIGRRDVDLWDQKTAALFVESDQRVFAGETASVEQFITTADGPRVFLTTKSPLRAADGKVVGLVGVARDITARKMAESELIELEIALEKAMPGIARISLDGCYLAVNVAYAQMHSRTPQELIGRSARETVHSDDLALMEDAWERLRNDGQAEGEYRGIRADGSVFFKHVFLVKPRIPTTNGTYCFMRDISDRRRQDERNLRVQKMDTAGRLAAHLASDLSNQLTTVLGNADQLAIRLQAALHPDDPAWRALSNLNLAAAEATNHARKLLAFGGPAIHPPRRFDVCAALRAHEPMVRRILGESIRLDLRLPTAPALIEFEQSQFESMIGHLARNARDAMPEAGEFQIEVEHVPLANGVGAREFRGPVVSMVFRDSGVGMSEGAMSHLFEPFYSTKPAGKGLGLGLATVHNSLSRHGGSIEVSSTLGRGTTIRVWLPAMDDSPSERSVRGEISRQQANIAAAGGIFLICESDAALALTVETALQMFGVRVKSVRRGREALDEVQQKRTDIHFLVTDMSLPDMSGRQLAELVRRLSPNVQVLFLAGNNEIDVTDSGYIEISDNVVIKPFQPAELVEKVRGLLANRIV